jgi:hypothetical protein
MAIRPGLSISLAAGLLLAGASLAQTTAANGSIVSTPLNPDATTRTVTGKVASSTSDAIAIDTDDGRQLTLVSDASTSRSLFSAGDRVSVRYATLSDGRFHADAVTLSSTSPAGDSSAYTTTSSMPLSPPATRMPKTASATPLVLLFGAMAGLGAALLHRAQWSA